jgi:hypothetical protein
MGIFSGARSSTAYSSQEAATSLEAGQIRQEPVAHPERPIIRTVG